MITSCWSKSNRFYTCMVYGVIAFNIFNIVKSTLNKTNAQTQLVKVNDPSGILKLLVKITEVLCVGISNYMIYSNIL